MAEPDKSKQSDGQSKEDGDAVLMAQLETIGSNYRYLAKLFFLCMIPSILNGLNVVSSVYLADPVPHWCHIPELDNVSWTTDQIRQISSPGNNETSCTYYDLDYVRLGEMGWEAALNASLSGERREIPCKSIAYGGDGSSMIKDFDLVCENDGYAPSIQFSLSLGKFLGAFSFGIVSDQFGRRTSFLLGSLLYIVSGPTIAFSNSFWLVLLGRVGIGAAGSGIYHSAFVILSEIASKRLRGPVGIIYNMSYPIGQMIIPAIAYYVHYWRTLQLIISVPAVLTILFWWFMPESPMWLLSKNERQKAEKFIKKEYTRIRTGPPEAHELQAALKDRVAPTVQVETPQRTTDQTWTSKTLGKLKEGCRQLWDMLTVGELAFRLLFSLFSWSIVSFSYYALALNVDNFVVNRYMYGFLTGLIEVPSYLVPLPFLRYLGRRHTAIILFYIAAVSLFAILAIPQTGYAALLMTVVSIGRLCVSAVFAVLILQTTELFPTLQRNTAIGLSSTSAHIGSMSAPYFVHFVGKLSHTAPTTIIGILAFVAGSLVFIMPETRGKPLPNSTQDILEGPKESKVGLHQICH